MPIEWWVSLSLAMLAIAVSPGNGAVLAMRYGLKGGVSYASPAIAGLQFGLLGVYGMVLISLMLTTRISPNILTIIAFAGGGYLLYLGARDIWNAWRHPEHAAKLQTGLQAEAQSIREPWLQRLGIGAITNLTNPKGIIFMTAFFPQWLRVDAPWPLAQQAVAMGCVAVLIDTVIMHGYASLASMIRHLLVRPSFFCIMETILGTVLCVMGVAMIWVRL